MANKPNVQIPTATYTSTHQAVFTAVGLVSSFFVGMSFIFALTKLVAPEPVEEPLPVVYATPMRVASINAATAQTTDANTFTVKFLGVQSKGFLKFGTLIGPDNQFTANTPSLTLLPLAIQISDPHTYAMITFSELLPTTDNPGGVQVRSICIPGKTTITRTNERKSILGIKTAQAQVNINSINAEPTSWSTYYIDNKGNAYYDQALSARANTVPCETIASKAYSPNTVTGGAINSIYPTEFRVLVWVVKDAKQIGVVDPTLGTAAGLQATLSGGKTPVVIGVGSTENTTELTLPTRTVTLVTDLGTTTVCIPEVKIPAKDSGLPHGTNFFFDKNGNAYKDIELTQPVSTTNCATALSKSFTPSRIASATFPSTFTERSKFTLSFIRDAKVIGGDNAPSDTTGLAGSKSPLLVRFNNSSSTIEQTIKTTTMSVRVDDIMLDLCVPASTLTVWHDFLTGYAQYYYDLNGKPYSDNLLTKQVQCPTVASCTCKTGKEACCNTNGNGGGQL